MRTMLALAVATVFVLGCGDQSTAPHDSDVPGAWTGLALHAPPFAPNLSLRWEPVASMPVALRGVTATSDPQFIYVLGGATMNRGGGWVDLFQR